MYVAPASERAWLLIKQRKMHKRERTPVFVITDGEPGAQRKVHAGFGRGRSETDPARAGHGAERPPYVRHEAKEKPMT
jgi:hypothetical protein